MKTYQDWQDSGKRFDDFIFSGDHVDAEMVDYFAGVVPPVTLKPGYVQCGEPVRHDSLDRPMFTTFVFDTDKWLFTGSQIKGERGLPSTP